MNFKGVALTDEQVLTALKKLRDFYYETHYQDKLYEGGLYEEQIAISDAIIEAFYLGHRGRKVKNIFISISRQFGKSFIVFSMIGFLLIFMPKFVGKPITVGITINKQDQVNKNYGEVRAYIERAVESYGMSFKTNTTKSLTLSNNSKIVIFSMEANHNEGETLDFSIVDEAQELTDVKYQKEIVPMMGRTGGVSCFAGVGGYVQNDYYYGVIDKEKNTVFHYGAEHCIETVRKRFEETGDERHLLYVTALEEAKNNVTDVTYKTQYKIEWELGVGQMITKENFELLRKRKKKIKENKEYDEKDLAGYAVKFTKYNVGIDWGKMGDRTVVSVVGKNTLDNKQVLVQQMVIKEENVPYTAQVERILAWLENKGYIDHIAFVFCDNTGPGTGPVDILTRGIKRGKVVPINFNELTKHEMALTFTNLVESNNLVLLETPENMENLESLEFEMSHLEKGYNKKGYIWFRHPEKGNIHDDYVDSTFLAFLIPKEKEVLSFARNL